MGHSAGVDNFYAGRHDERRLPRYGGDGQRLRITHDLAFNVGDHQLEAGVFQLGR